MLTYQCNCDKYDLNDKRGKIIYKYFVSLQIIWGLASDIFLA